MCFNHLLIFSPTHPLLQEVETIFDHLSDILELSTQLQASIEDTIEIYSEMSEGEGGASRHPPIGFCFEEIAEVHNAFSFPSLSHLLLSLWSEWGVLCVHLLHWELHGVHYGSWVYYQRRGSCQVVQGKTSTLPYPLIIKLCSQDQSANGQLPKLFKESVQYVLPKALLEPIYHFFYYCNILTVSQCI